MDILFCALWGLPVTDVFFVQLRILVFDCEGLFKNPLTTPRSDILRQSPKE